VRRADWRSAKEPLSLETPVGDEEDSLDDIRRRLHAADQAGRLIVGADVAVATWRVTPGESWLATLLGNPVMLPITRVVYDRFADLLFAWNKRKRRW
jgi:predicted DCC family thiol-disulfide oxidoreductase YuxK